MIYNRIQEGSNGVGGVVVVLTHPALFCRTKEGGEIQLLITGIEACHQVEDHILHLAGAAIGFVYFIDYHNGLEP